VGRAARAEHLQTYVGGAAEAAAIALRRRPERRRSQAAESSGTRVGKLHEGRFDLSPWFSVQPTSVPELYGPVGADGDESLAVRAERHRLP
jgi:hypothetical protein